MESGLDARPKRAGPFASWDAAAVDALTNCAFYAARWRDWSPGGLLTLLEQYNGLRIREPGRPSPYIWAGTDQYVRGRYVADGQYDPNVVDNQPGCAGLLLAMAEIDQPAGCRASARRPPRRPRRPLPQNHPSPISAPGSIGAWLVSILSIFKKKRLIMFWLLLTAFTPVLAYILVVRPILKAVPAPKAFYTEADTFWQKAKALCWNSLTVAWSYVIAAVGVVLQQLDTIAGVFGDPDLKR